MVRVIAPHKQGLFRRRLGPPSLWSVVTVSYGTGEHLSADSRRAVHDCVTQLLCSGTTIILWKNGARLITSPYLLHLTSDSRTAMEVTVPSAVLYVVPVAISISSIAATCTTAPSVRFRAFRGRRPHPKCIHPMRMDPDPRFTKKSSAHRRSANLIIQRKPRPSRFLIGLQDQTCSGIFEAEIRFASVLDYDDKE